MGYNQQKHCVHYENLRKSTEREQGGSLFKEIIKENFSNPEKEMNIHICDTKGPQQAQHQEILTKTYYIKIVQI